MTTIHTAPPTPLTMLEPHGTRYVPASTTTAPDLFRFAIAPSTLGLVLVATSAAGVCAVLLGDDAATLADELQGRFPGAAPSDDAAVRELAARVAAFVERPSAGLDVPLDPRGTAFQRTVWEALRRIPPGETATYTEIATRIGMPTAARAVARACAANPIAVLVPCHRVVRGDGSLSGYRWGVARKRALLDREAAPSS